MVHPVQALLFYIHCLILGLKMICPLIDPEFRERFKINNSIFELTHNRK